MYELKNNVVEFTAKTTGTDIVVVSLIAIIVMYFTAGSVPQYGIDYVPNN